MASVSALSFGSRRTLIVALVGGVMYMYEVHRVNVNDNFFESACGKSNGLIHKFRDYYPLCHSEMGYDRFGLQRDVSMALVFVSFSTDSSRTNVYCTGMCYTLADED